jgi:hypothetical protein
MKSQKSLRESYRMLVSLLIIPLGAIITVRALTFGLQAWTLVILGLAFIALGVVRLWNYYRQSVQLHKER